MICIMQLHARLVATVDSKNFLSQLESQQEKMVEESDCMFPFKKASGSSASFFN